MSALWGFKAPTCDASDIKEAAASDFIKKCHFTLRFWLVWLWWVSREEKKSFDLTRWQFYRTSLKRELLKSYFECAADAFFAFASCLKAQPLNGANLISLSSMKQQNIIVKNYFTVEIKLKTILSFSLHSWMAWVNEMEGGLWPLIGIMGNLSLWC